jgi:hypothetical protein
VVIRERVGSGKQLDESAFVDWYVRMIFATDEDADADVEEGEVEGQGGLSVDEDGAGAGGSTSKALKSAPATGSWPGVKWAVAPMGRVLCGGQDVEVRQVLRAEPVGAGEVLGVRVCGAARGGAGPCSGPGHCGRTVARGGLDLELGLYFLLPGRGRGLQHWQLHIRRP